MNNSSSTSTTGTPKPGRAGDTASSPSGTSESSASPTGDSGRSCTIVSTEEESGIPMNECDISFLMGASGFHPIAIICNTHGWKGDVQ